MNALTPEPTGSPVTGPAYTRPGGLPVRRRIGRPGGQRLQATRAWLHRNGHALTNTLHGVAGECGAAAARRLIDDLRQAQGWTAAFDRRLAHLRGLLLLEHLEDSDSLYPVPDAVLSGADQELICACCYHAERLQELIDADWPASITT